MKLRTLISLFSVSLIAFQVGHDTIPHHHHPGSHVSDVEEACVSDYCPGDRMEESAHHSDFHCHAFNNVQYVRTRIIAGLQNNLPGLDIFRKFPDIHLPILYKYQTFSIEEATDFKESDFLSEHFYLRGPPGKV